MLYLVLKIFYIKNITIKLFLNETFKFMQIFKVLKHRQITA